MSEDNDKFNETTTKDMVAAVSSALHEHLENIADQLSRIADQLELVTRKYPNSEVHYISTGDQLKGPVRYMSMDKSASSKNSKMTITTIPAQPGFDLVITTDTAFVFYPVIACAIVMDETSDSYFPEVYPLCANNEFNYGGGDVRHPDGSITFQYDRTFAKGQEAEALAYSIAETRALERRRKGRGWRR